MIKLIRRSFRYMAVVTLLIVAASCSGYEGTTTVAYGGGYGYGPGYGYGSSWGRGWGGSYYPGRPMGPYW